jgi:putative FmdB family regulatory protein
VPLYEYRCRTCDEHFELRRAMSDANAPASCPSGHGDTVRLLSLFGVAGSAADASPAMASSAPAGGGCCGGACGCRH